MIFSLFISIVHWLYFSWILIILKFIFINLLNDLASLNSILKSTSFLFLIVFMSAISIICPLDIKATLSQVSSISLNIWDDINIVFPFWCSRLIIFKNASLINGSNPVVGSSKIIIGESAIKAATKAVFCFIPLLILFKLALGSSCNSFIKESA